MAVTKPKAIRQVKFCISMMTRRFSVETIKNTHKLEQVDINTSRKIELLKGRLAASVRADMVGSLDKSTFMSRLRFTTKTTVEKTGARLLVAYLAAWSPKHLIK